VPTEQTSTLEAREPSFPQDEPVPNTKPRPAARGDGAAAWRRRLLFAALPVVLVAGGVAYATGGRVLSVENAYVDMDKVGASTDIAGTVTQVEVSENQKVQAGQVLYRLDQAPFRLALDRADGQLGVIANELAATQASYRDYLAQVRQAAVDVSYYQTERQRQQELLAQHVASLAAFEAADRNLQAAQQKSAAIREQLAGVAAHLDGQPGESLERNPKYLEAKAQRDEAQRQLDHTVVRAPFAGVVTGVGATAPGRFLPASTPAFYLVGTERTWVEATPKETELTYVRIGQPAVVKVDTYPGASWRGVVESISPAAAQEFSLLPAQNTSGNWVKVVQRIPLRVRVTPDPRLPPLRAGMSVVAQIDTGRARGLPFFNPGAGSFDARGR
jgi:membrane fusion protein (multidrug efflux system)